MSNKQNLQLLKVKVNLKAAGKVLSRPAYLLLAVVGMIVASGLILWSLNLDLLGYIWFDAPLSFVEKIDFFFSVYRDIYTTHNGIEGTGIVLFSVLFGVNLALIVFVLKHRGVSSVPKKSGAGGLVFAVIGGGCVACGTSILAPILATVGATSGIFVRQLAVAFNFLGVMLILFSIYTLGGLCATALALEKQKKQ